MNKKLSELVVRDISYGVLKPGENNPNGVPLVRINNISKSNTFIEDDMIYITNELSNEYKRTVLTGNELLFSVVGSIGRILDVPSELSGANISRALAIISPTDEINKKYLYYYLQSPNVNRYIEKEMQGNAQKVLNLSVLRNLDIPILPLKEQQKIADILSSVDAAIEKTEQVIAKTEEVKKGLMQQLLTKGIGHTEFKESLFGLIPKDWMLVSLSEVADVRDGTHDSPKYQSSGIPFITSKNLRNGKIDFSDCNYITIEDHKKFSVRSFVEKGDILFGMIGTIGSPVIVDIDFDFSIKNVALIKLNKDIVDNRYMKYLLESNLIQKEFSRVSDGGVQKFVALSTIRKLKVPLPNLYEQQKIAKILLNQDSYLDSQFKKLSYLQEIKKGLMQQLLTGQVRVGALC